MFSGRLELDHAAIELTVADGVVPSGRARSAGDFVRLAGLWYGSPRANSSAFCGIGLGYGWSGGANGFDATITAGYEMLRATTMRALLQLDVTLPTYSGNEAERKRDGRSRHAQLMLAVEPLPLRTLRALALAEQLHRSRTCDAINPAGCDAAGTARACHMPGF